MKNTCNFQKPHDTSQKSTIQIVKTIYIYTRIIAYKTADLCAGTAVR